MIVLTMLKTVITRSWAVPAHAKAAMVASWLLGVPQLNGWSRETYQFWRKLLQNRGLTASQGYFKAARWALTKKFANDPLRLPGVRVDRKGFPVVLPKELRLLLGQPHPSALLRAVSLLLLSLHLLYKNKKMEVRYETITTPLSTEAEARVEELRGQFRRLLPRLARGLGVGEPLRLKDVRFHLTNRGGPNGHALLCAHLDAAAVYKADVGGWLREWVTKVYPKSGPTFLTTMDRLARLTEDLGILPGRKLAVGKIGRKLEPTKVRLFAIGDYFSQAACRPLHVALMERLRSIPMDATWNQESGSRQVQKWTAEGRQLWSFDLSAATDRFPVSLQAELVSFLLRRYGTGLGDTWRMLLTDRGYRTASNSTTEVRYAVGQPMGFLSSWAAFALTHHLVVQWSALRATVELPFREYTLLGDDIVIAHEGVAHRYQELMNLLEVNINLNKSIRAQGAAEFAKRTFVGGEEITGLLWSMFVRASSSPLGFFLVVEEITRRGFTASLAGCVLASLGHRSTRKVGGGLRCLLLALVEPGGPLENEGIWRLVLPAAVVADYHDAFLPREDGTLSGDQASIRPKVSGRWAIARSLSEGVAIAPLLRGQADFEDLRSSLSILLASQIEATSRNHAPHRWDMDQFLQLHPAGVQTEETLKEESDWYKKVPRMGIMTRADKEYLTAKRDHFVGASERAMLVQMAYVGQED